MTTEKQKSNSRKIRDKWIKTRSKGKTHFVLVNGILFQGLPMAIFFLLISHTYNYFYDQTAFSSSSNIFIIKIIVNLLIWSLAGCVINWLLWNERENEFSQDISFESR